MGGKDIQPDELPKDPFKDTDFLDISEELIIARRKRLEDKKESDEVQEASVLEQGTRKARAGLAGERKFPAVIDVFLYPFSMPALGFLGVIFGVPLAMYIIREFILVAILILPAFVILLFAHFIVNILIEIVLALYLLWYYCQCIHDSGVGGIRAPETIAIAPSIGEIFLQCLKFWMCLVMCIGPFLAYSYGLFSEVLDHASLWGQFPNVAPEVMRQGSFISLLLLILGIFFFPMVLLSVVMFDSFWGFNPILIISSIFSVFFQYCGLLLLYLGMWMLLFGVMFLLQTYLYMPVALNGFIGRCVGIYICLVSCHLIGRFYWRYEKKLNWDI
jgi:hypothetical protein